MRFRASWRGTAEPGGEMATLGVLVAGDDRIGFKALPPFAQAEAKFSEVLASSKLSADETFDYFVERANGWTETKSDPWEVNAPNLQFALDRIIAERMKSPVV